MYIKSDKPYQLTITVTVHHTKEETRLTGGDTSIFAQVQGGENNWYMLNCVRSITDTAFILVSDVEKAIGGAHERISKK